MKVVIRKSYFFEKQDKTQLRIFLLQNNMGYREFAQKLGISFALLSAITNGHRALTPKVAKKLEKNGFKVELE